MEPLNLQLEGEVPGMAISDTVERLRNRAQGFTDILDTANRYLMVDVVPYLSRAVLDRATRLNDARRIWDIKLAGHGIRSGYTSEWFRSYVNFREERLTRPAALQIIRIDVARYSFAEAISMMLEQADYWRDDAEALVELAFMYLDNKFGPNEEVTDGNGEQGVDGQRVRQDGGVGASV